MVMNVKTLLKNRKQKMIVGKYCLREKDVEVFLQHFEEFSAQ